MRPRVHRSTELSSTHTRSPYPGYKPLDTHVCTQRVTSSPCELSHPFPPPRRDDATLKGSAAIVTRRADLALLDANLVKDGRRVPALGRG